MAFNLFKTIGNVIEHPVTAYNNLSNRTAQYAQAGYNLPDTLKYAFTPQTAYAQDSTKGLDYSQSPINNQYVPTPPTEYPYNGVANSAAAFPQFYNQPSTPTQTPKPTSQPTANTQTTGGASGGTSSGSTGTQQPQSLGFFMGKEYFDPAQLYQDQLSYLDNVYGTNLSGLRKGKQNQVDTYTKQKTDLATQLQDLLSQYADQQKTGMGNLASYYGGLGDIYQSSQGTREADLANQVNTASTKAKTTATQGQSAIDKALQDYLGNYGQSENQLAAQYQTAKDQIANGLVQDLGSRVGVQQAVGNGVQTNLTPDQINTNSDLIAQLNALRTGSTFNNPFNFQQGQLQTNPILQYLAGLGA